MLRKAFPNSLQSILSRWYRSLILFTVMLASVTTVIFSIITILHYKERSLELAAHSVAYTVEPAIVFGDLEAVRETMQSIATDSVLERMAIVDLNGDEIVSWNRRVSGLIPDAVVRLGDRLLFSTPSTAKISHNGEQIAELRLYGSSYVVLQFLLAGLLTSLVCICIAIVATSLMARRLRMGVINPLNHVAEVARSVRLERAFSKRVPAPGLAEVDDFVEDFNLLLGELEEWYDVLRQENKSLERRALRDPLTGVGNRSLFEQRLDQALNNAADTNTSFALLYLDANLFKQINDNFGHEAGDAVLRAISERLLASTRSSDDVYRLGGDEFTIIVESPGGVPEIQHVMERIAEAMRQPIETPSDGDVYISLSMGYAFYPHDAQTAAELINVADEAMYRDKIRRRNNEVASYV